MKCKIEGHTQAAHMHKYGQKSKGKKVCDTQARPLCTVGGNDCHGKLDRHEEEWTQEEIERALDMPLYELYASKADATARMLIEEF